MEAIQMEKTKYTTVECKVGSNTVRVHHPERTQEEQRRYQANLEQALQAFGRDMVKAGLL